MGTQVLNEALKKILLGKKLNCWKVKLSEMMFLGELEKTKGNCKEAKILKLKTRKVY